ncbi:PREDICTED: uncharacterized protein LOC104822181 [Tarenaya hassleriana]|uniref:uncharacterized protein LOC104822181 n=1 Tax=Tarenaya hassleriana TaxID=28532 RepID=UPI00053C7351|nr:PREDICTED: uncharacterized protein LOC104822181 [Tarenaya hassleriana]
MKNLECGEIDVYVDHHLSQPTPVKLVDVNVVEEEPLERNIPAEEYREQIYVGDLGGYNSNEDDDFAVDSSSEDGIYADDDSLLGDSSDSQDDDDFVEEVPLGVGVVSDVGNADSGDEASTDEYLDSDDYIPVTPDCSDEERERGEKPRKKPMAFPSDELLFLGKTFNSRDDFKKALLDYALKKNFNVKLSRWEREKLNAICCTEGCPWRVYCSVEAPISKWMIKIYKDDHNHDPGTHVNILTMRKIAILYADRFRREPDWKAEKMQIAIQEEYGLIVPLSKCFKARRVALKMVMEDPSVQIAKLWEYELELHRSNPNTTTEIGTQISTQGEQAFDRFYVSFEALRESWKNHCRPVIGLDGCFLKWDMKGELLAAVGRDANNDHLDISLMESDGVFLVQFFVTKMFS